MNNTSVRGKSSALVSLFSLSLVSLVSLVPPPKAIREKLAQGTSQKAVFLSVGDDVAGTTYKHSSVLRKK